MDLVLRTLVIFLVILVLTRMLGRRELSSLEPFDLSLLAVLETNGQISFISKG